MRDDIEIIELARQPDFTLGSSLVRPASLEVMKNGKRDTLEPRVMQVLVALYRGHPNVVSRDDLIASCWEGRVVGDDAINRAIGRLRRLSESDYGASFTIETIPRVGYRLAVAGQREVEAIQPVAGAEAEAARRPSRTRRSLLLAGAGVVTGLAGAGTAAWVLTRPPAPVPSPKAAGLIERAYLTLRQASAEDMAQGLALFQQAVQQAPESADAWAGLALAYAFAASYLPAKAAANRLRGRDALAHARLIDPHNARAYEAEIWLQQPGRDAWRDLERIYREALHFHPEFDGITLTRALFLSEYGRNKDAADMAARAIASAKAPDPALSWISIQCFWGAARLAEADTAASRGFTLFPRHTSVWYSRVFLLMFTGRQDEALATLRDEDGRPPGVPDEDFDGVIAVAIALKTQAKADITRAVALQTAMARRASGWAENAIGFLSGLGEQDGAFAIAEALYFGRGFQIGDLRYSAAERVHTDQKSRNTRPLFLPWSKAMRRDRRFAPLVAELGLDQYWQSTGIKPDYQLGRDI